jgi:hypothetical protein
LDAGLEADFASGIAMQLLINNRTDEAVALLWQRGVLLEQMGRVQRMRDGIIGGLRWSGFARRYMGC